MKVLTILLLLLASFSCENVKDFKPDFENHKYDPSVVALLPQYDTLRQIVLNSFDSFNLKKNYDLTYFYNFDSTSQIVPYSNFDLPKKIYPQTVELIERIGEANIFGFTISLDTTFEILVRNTHLTKYYLDVRERLIWSPKTKSINISNFPIKDTSITDKWHYRIWYDKRADFF